MSYAERCLSIVNSIDHNELECREANQLVGQSRVVPQTAVYALGSMSTSEGQLWVAIKRTAHVGMRARFELADTIAIEKRVPELIAKLPAFIGTVSVEGAGKPIAILTEDASEGGSYRVQGTRLSTEAQEAIDAGFDDIGGLEGLDDETILDHTTFVVNGRERILDLTPSIFLGSDFQRIGSGEYDVASSHARDLGEKLDIRISADSALAQSLQ